MILHYLHCADGAPDSSPLVTFGGLQDGLIRGTKFDHASEKEISRFITGKHPAQIQEVCLALGAVILDSRADRYLTIEDAVTVGEIMLKSLENTYRQMYGG